MTAKFASISLALAIALTACGPGQGVIPSPTATPVPSATLAPSATPRPSRTPNLAATEQYSQFFGHIQDFASKGYLPSTDGAYGTLQDQLAQLAKMDYYQYFRVSKLGPDFVSSAHIEWSTAADVPAASGCGFVFGVQKDYYYGVVLDRSRIQFIQSDKNYWYELGKTRGSGRVSFGNPAEADLTLIVSEGYAYVLVDDELIGEYTLSQDHTAQGEFGYSILSGTNKDYGTRCEITNWHYWKVFK